MLKRIGTMDDGREVYIDENNKLWAKNELPLKLGSPTSTKIEQFKEDHPNAIPCPKCGYRYYVHSSGVEVAYHEGFCRICDAHSSVTKVRK